jgi:hypothetical protein
MCEKTIVFEETPDNRADLQELVVIRTFAEVGSAEVRAFAAVSDGIGRRDHDHGQMMKALAGANAAEYVEAIDARQIEVEKDGVKRCGVGIFLGAFDGGNSHFAIRGRLDIQIEMFQLEGFANEQGIG